MCHSSGIHDNTDVNELGKILLIKLQEFLFNNFDLSINVNKHLNSWTYTTTTINWYAYFKCLDMSDGWANLGLYKT